MRAVYAFQCQVLHPTSQPPRRCLEILAGDLEDWLRRNLRRSEVDPPLPEEMPIEPGEVFEVSWDSVAGRDRVTIEFPFDDPEDADLECILACIALGGTRWSELSIVLSVLSRRFQVKPLLGTHMAIPLVPEIVRKYRCQIDGQPVPTVPRQLPAHDVERFVRTQLANPRRALPVVMIAPADLTGVLPIVAEPLQERLLGFAEVVVLSENAVTTLAQCLGAERACPHGALRLYWPGFDKEADPQRHQVRLGRELENDAAQGYQLDRSLLTIFVTAAAERYCLRATGALDSTDKDNANDGGRLAELEALRAANARLEEECASLRRQVEGSRAVAEACQSELASAGAAAVKERERRRQAAERGHGRMGRGDSRKETVAGALLAASEDFADMLTVFESAVESAGRSSSSRGPAVYRGLQAVAEVGRLYFEARREGCSMGPLEDAFHSRIPFKYTATESPTTVSMLGQTRVFRHQGRSRLMLQHLTLARGDRTNCVQIYFEFDDQTGRAEIGYCGKHLPISQQPT